MSLVEGTVATEQTATLESSDLTFGGDTQMKTSTTSAKDEDSVPFESVLEEAVERTGNCFLS